MTDGDVEREIEANKARARQHNSDTGGGIVDAAEDMVDPIVDTFPRGDDAEDVDIPEDRVRQNDADQRPD